MNTFFVLFYVYNESRQDKYSKYTFIVKKTAVILIIMLIVFGRQLVFSTYFLSESFPLNVI